METYREDPPIYLQPAVQQFLEYPFDTDDDFQQGLAGILSNAALAEKSQDEKETLILSSKLFYYNRMRGLNLTVEQVRRYAPSAPLTIPSHDGSSAANAEPETVANEDGEERVLSFAELKELIEQGKTDQIPHNKKIPDVVNQDTPSESKAAIRRKPWEVATDAADA